MHLDTLAAMGNLAIACLDLGQLEEAARLNQELFESFRRVLGSEYPWTLNARSGSPADAPRHVCAGRRDQGAEKIRGSRGPLSGDSRRAPAGPRPRTSSDARDHG